jgi:hypothetical protein
MRNRGSWTDAKLEYLENVLRVLDDMEEYWPLTLRQVYYQLVSELLIDNNRGQYQKLSRILSQARIDGKVDWEAIEDRTRERLGSAGWADADSFVRQELEGLLDGYRKHLLIGQPVALELWVEKDALSRVCHDIAFEYCIPVVVAKGFSSVSYVHQSAERVRINADDGLVTRILYFGDLDPSGWEMLPSMMHTLKVEMELGDSVEGVRCALTENQVSRYRLPHSPDAIKKTDSRAAKYVERFGTLAVELDALKPRILQGIIRGAIEENLNMGLFSRQKEEQGEERDRIRRLRDEVASYADAQWAILNMKPSFCPECLCENVVKNPDGSAYEYTCGDCGHDWDED